MNGLTWTLYLIGVLPNISSVFCGISILLGIAFVAWLTAWFATEGEVPKPSVHLFVWASVFSLLSSVIPSENTMYLMLASEVGEQVATTETGEKVLTEIQDIVTLKLAEIKEGIVKK